MHKSIIEKLDAIPMQELFKYYHVDWEEGRNFRCPFPAHGATGSTPSGRFYPTTNSFGCFGCHRGGGPVHFVMNMEGISYIKACEKLMSMYNIDDIPDFSYQTIVDRQVKKEEQADERIKFGVLSDMLSKMDPYSKDDQLKFSFMYSMLNQCTGTQFLQLSIDGITLPLEQFLTKIPDGIKDTQKKALDLLKSFVYVRHPFEQERSFNYAAIYSGFYSDQMSNYSWPSQNNRYILPLFLPGKFICGFSGRTLNPSETLKYNTELMFQLTKKDVAYGLDVALPYIEEAGCCVIVEGILDAVRCWSLGFKNVVAPCCAYVSDNLAILLKGLTDTVYLMQDNDYGGNQEAKLSEQALQRHKMKSYRLLVPEGEDPDSFGLHNLAGLQELLKQAKN